MRNMTKNSVEIISNTYMYLFYEKGMRGRGSYTCKRYSKASNVSYISKRYSKASNKYLKCYDTKQEWKYLGANNLVDYATSNFLSTGGFKLVDPEEVDSNKCNSKISICFALQVDLKYQKQLRHLCNDYPLAPGKIKIKKRVAELSIKDCWSL